MTSVQHPVSMGHITSNGGADGKKIEVMLEPTHQLAVSPHQLRPTFLLRNYVSLLLMVLIHGAHPLQSSSLVDVLRMLISNKKLHEKLATNSASRGARLC